MNYRSLLIACLATLGLAVAGWGQADGKDVDNPADPSLPAGIGQAVTSSNGEAWVVGAIHRLTDHSANYRSPSWSPDGRHITFDSNRHGKADIYVMGSDGSNRRNLTNDSDWHYDPSWSPDGQHIAFVTVAGRYNKAEIYVMDSDGSNPRRLTDHPGPVWSPSWSPDGQHIAFESNRHGEAEIYVMGSDGSNPRHLTDHPAEDRSPSWSPDGQHIAFESERDGRVGIYVMDSDFGWEQSPPSDRPPGRRPVSVLVSGWPAHRLRVQPRQRLGDLRDGYRVSFCHECRNPVVGTDQEAFARSCRQLSRRSDEQVECICRLVQRLPEEFRRALDTLAIVVEDLYQLKAA